MMSILAWLQYIVRIIIQLWQSTYQSAMPIYCIVYSYRACAWQLVITYATGYCQEGSAYENIVTEEATMFHNWDRMDKITRGINVYTSCIQSMYKMLKVFVACLLGF